MTFRSILFQADGGNAERGAADLNLDQIFDAVTANKQKNER